MTGSVPQPASDDQSPVCVALAIEVNVGPVHPSAESPPRHGQTVVPVGATRQANPFPTPQLTPAAWRTLQNVTARPSRIGDIARSAQLHIGPTTQEFQ
jgi:hypothetical protein